MLRYLVFVAPIMLILSTAALSETPQAAASGVATSGDFAGLVDIGGRRLYLTCKGSGTPTVILEPGAGNNGAIWSEVDPKAATQTSVFDGVAQFTRVCAYDRPGTIAGSEMIERSRSDPAPMPRSAGDVVADLSALLTAAGARPPYVLVGHSFGGLVVRLFASTLPATTSSGLSWLTRRRRISGRSSRRW